MSIFDYKATPSKSAGRTEPHLPNAKQQMKSRHLYTPMHANLRTSENKKEKGKRNEKRPGKIRARRKIEFIMTRENQKTDGWTDRDGRDPDAGQDDSAEQYRGQ